MLKKIIKWSGISLGGLVLILLIVLAFVYYKSNSILNQTFVVPPSQAIYVEKDSLTLAKGKHLAEALAMCVDCHGHDFAGAKVIDFPPLARIYGPNLTGGKGSVIDKNYSIKDFERVVRHAVKRDGKIALIMPAEGYCYLSDEEVAALYDYVMSMPKIDKEQPELSFGPLGRLLMVKGIDFFSTGKINHDKKAPPVPPVAPDKEYGQHLAQLACMGCHSPNLSGGVIEGGDPSWPPASNITRGGAIKDYSEADFFRALREGVRPGGNAINPAMPTRYTRNMSDVEIKALWEYLNSVPPAAMGSSTWKGRKVP